MNHFTITQLQQYTGIKAHTIRMWEQRYDALKPDRSEGNTRYYDASQLKRILSIVSLMGFYYKISDLCTMSDARLSELHTLHFNNNSSSDSGDDFFIAQIISSAMEYDEVKFDRLFSNCVLRMGLKDTYSRILLPLLNRLGMLWLKDTIPPAQEHFITNLIRRKILTATDAVVQNEASVNKWILFLPEDEFHECGLMIANYLIRSNGHMTYYLGANLPEDTLIEAVRVIKPSHLLCFLVSKNDNDSDMKFARQLNKSFPDLKLLIACRASRIDNRKLSKNIKVLTSVNDLTNKLN